VPQSAGDGKVEQISFFLATFGKSGLFQKLSVKNCKLASLAVF